MITYVPRGIELPEEGIKNGSYTNDDGHGWAIASSDGIQIGKSMDFNEAWEGLLEARKVHGKNSLVMFHSRFATHGTVDTFNVHPFWADEYTAVAHNGILPIEWHPSKKDKRSDTQILVDRTIPHYLNEESGVPSRKAGRLLGKMIGSGNKLTILSVKSGVPKVRIINAHLGEHSEGVWYSNSGYRWGGYRSPVTKFRSYDYSRWEPSTRYIGGYQSAYDLDATPWPDEPASTNEYEDRACDVCNSHATIQLETGWCEVCHVCSGCYHDDRLCQCSWNQRLMIEAASESQAEIEAAIAETLNPEFSAATKGYDPDLGGWVLG
jgi:hypothetical protein